jgi:hypothetical protein
MSSKFNEQDYIPVLVGDSLIGKYALSLEVKLRKKKTEPQAIWYDQASS